MQAQLLLKSSSQISCSSLKYFPWTSRSGIDHTSTPSLAQRSLVEPAAHHQPPSTRTQPTTTDMASTAMITTNGSGDSDTDPAVQHWQRQHASDAADLARQQRRTDIAFRFWQLLKAGQPHVQHLADELESVGLYDSNEDYWLNQVLIQNRLVADSVSMAEAMHKSEYAKLNIAMDKEYQSRREVNELHRRRTYPAQTVAYSGRPIIQSVKIGLMDSKMSRRASSLACNVCEEVI